MSAAPVVPRGRIGRRGPIAGRRLAARLGAAAVALPAGAWAIGVNWILSLLIAGVGAAAVAILELPALAQEPTWPVPEEHRRGGGRRELTNLSWMFTSRHGGIDPAALLRLRAIARRRLALRGIDLDAPADRERAIAALGQQGHAILLTEDAAALSHRQITVCIEALERLDPGSASSANPPGPNPASPNPAAAPTAATAPPSGPTTGMTHP